MIPAAKVKPQYEVLVFLVVTFLLTWLLWLPALLIRNFGVSLGLPYGLLITLGTFIPSIAGFVFAYVFGGKGEVTSLWKSLLNIHIKVQWWLFIFLVPSAVSAVSCLLLSLLGGTLPPMQFAVWFLPIAFLYILVLMGPLAEEVGWRGFALKRILKTYSPLKAAVLLGIVWSVWHAPLFLISGTTQNALMEFGSGPAFLGYSLYTVMLSVLITLLYSRSNGSVLGAILLHTMANVSLGVVPIIFTQTGALILLSVLSITTTVFVIRYRRTMLCAPR